MPRTGRTVWSTQVASKADDYSITSAPRVIKGRVITGSSGSEFGVRGFVAAYDASTGKQVWRFWTVPGDPSLGFENAAMARAATTWNGAWWKYGGGGTPWDGMAYDPELDLLYIGTGNGSPWSRELRSPGGGDNLYLCSILAIRPDTGEYVWHYQTTPADNWDYASTQPIVLADLKLDGRVRKVLMQAPKNGFFYVIDRATGAFISAQPFTTVTWASGIDQVTGRPIETPEANYGTTGQRLSPGSDGAHSWHAMAWHPGAGLAYIPGQHTTGTYAWDPDFQHQMGRMNTGRPRNRPAPADAATHPGGAAAASTPPVAAAPAATATRRPPQIVGAGGGQQQGAFLVAWDPVTQKERWRLTFDRPGITGGTLATAGNLLFHGSNDGSFSAYTADSGREALVGAAGARLCQPDHVHARRRAVRDRRHGAERHAGARPAVHVCRRRHGGRPVDGPGRAAGGPVGHQHRRRHPGRIRARRATRRARTRPGAAVVRRLPSADRRHPIPAPRGWLARDGGQHGRARHARHPRAARDDHQVPGAPPRARRPLNSTRGEEDGPRPPAGGRAARARYRGAEP